MANAARAIASNDVVLLAWRLDDPLPGCRGFAIKRTDQANGQSDFLPAWVGFEGGSNPGWEQKDTHVWPVQKFTWRDFTGRPGKSYRYRVIPMTGPPGKLTAQNGQGLDTDTVTLTGDLGDVEAYFTRGILSTQSLTRQLPKTPDGSPDAQVLRHRIDQPGDPLRGRLAGDALVAMKAFLNRARTPGGELYCALYELDDVELLQELLSLAAKVHIVLANTGPDDARNKPARQALHEAGIDITDRMLPDKSEIGHNKFMVHVDTAGGAAAVLTGSTNWTDTGLCAQANNVIILESTELAAAYLGYWKRLKGDKARQSAAFRKVNRANPTDATLDANATDVRIWFSPNTTARKKPAAVKAAPVDMGEVLDLIRNAQEAVLFLLFLPGSPSILDAVKEVQKASPAVLIHGAISDANTVNLFHRQVTGNPARYVVGVGKVKDQFAYWEAEIDRLGVAVIHDKIVVVDPFSAHCAVVTGSHNLGYKASYSNDENMVIVRRSRALARAYAAHIMDVYDYYRWRWRLSLPARQGGGARAWTGLKKTDAWQKPYFDPTTLAFKEIRFWNP